VREQLRAALLAMAKTPEGRALLAAVPINGLEPARLDDYRAVAELGLDRIAVWE
jgi:ABC-type phosphate/phosphonate transport system substrate-binding protein